MTINALRDETKIPSAPRHDATNEELTAYVQTNFSGSPESLHELEPSIGEIQRRFKHLSKKLDASGQRSNIAGHKNFKSWCAGILNRTVNEINALFEVRIVETKKQKKTLVDKVNAALDTRHEDTDEKLTEFCRNHFSDSLLSLRQILPELTEVSRRFRILPRGLGVDGKYKTICGYRTFKAWCGTSNPPTGVLHRTAHRVRQLLKEARGEESEKKAKEISVLSASLLVEKYLTSRAEKFENSERTQFLKTVEKIVKELQDEKILTASTKAEG